MAGRGKTRARRAANGTPQTNTKSKTKPSAIAYRDRKRQERDIGTPFPQKHQGRVDKRRALAEELGLPPETKFIFRHRITDPEEQKKREIVELHFGTTAVINKEDNSLILAVRCTRFDSMSKELKEEFWHSISTTFQLANNRIPCDKHNSIQVLQDEGKFWGWMGCCGWRPGMDDGKSLGVYALCPYISYTNERIDTDKDLTQEFRRIRDFWADRFATLSLRAFESNRKLAEEVHVPGFDELEWEDSPSGEVFASNLVVTKDCFYNESHQDTDLSRYSFGMNCRIKRATGEPHELGGEEYLGDVKGSKFIIPEFGIEVDFDGCDGIYELVWDVKILHYTDQSHAFDAEGELDNPETSAITRYGSSCQISAALANRIRIPQEKRKGESDEEWAKKRRVMVKWYSDETKNKKTGVAKREAARAEAAEAKKRAREAKKQLASSSKRKKQ